MYYPIKYFSDTQEETYPSSTVYEDNATCLQFDKMPKLSPHTNHIGLPYRWFLWKLSSLEIEIHGVSSNYQLAD